MSIKVKKSDALVSAPLLVYIAAVASAGYVTYSHAHLTALNFFYITLFGLFSAVWLSVGHIKGTKNHDREQNSLSILAVLGLLCGAALVLSSILSGRFMSSIFGLSTSHLGLITYLSVVAIGLYGARNAAAIGRVLVRMSPWIILVFTVGMWLQGGYANPAGEVIDSSRLGFGNSSALGIFITILFPFLLSFSSLSFKNEKFVRLALALFALYTLYSDRMQLSLILCGAFLLWRLVIMSRLSEKNRIRVFIAGISSLGLGILGLIFLYLQGVVQIDLFANRGQLWTAALEGFLQSPLLGFGADGFTSAVGSLPKPADWWGGASFILGEGSSDPHNIVVMFLVSFGLVGTLLLLAYFISFFARVYRGSKQIFFKEYSVFILSALGAGLSFLTQPAYVNLLGVAAIVWGGALGYSDAAWLRVTKKSQDRKGKKQNKLSVVSPRMPDGHSPVFLKSDAFLNAWSSARLIMIVAGIIICAIGLSNAVARLVLGPVSQYQAAPIETAFSAYRLASYDPYFTIQVNNAMRDGFWESSEQEELITRFQALHTQNMIARDRVSPELPLSQAEAYLAIGKSNEEVRQLLNESLNRYPDYPWALARLVDLSISEGDMNAAQKYAQGIINLGDLGERIFGSLLAKLD